MSLVAGSAVADGGPVNHVVAAPGPKSPSLSMWAASAPQVGHVSTGGRAKLTDRVTLDVGGWNVFGTDPTAQATFLRGGWAGARLSVLDAPSLYMLAWARLLALQPSATTAASAGGSAGAQTTLNLFSWLTLVPEFELTWLPMLTTAHLTVAYRFTAGDWRLDARGGAQLWVRDGAVTVAPVGELTVGWLHDFSVVDVGVSAGAAITRDGALVVQHPLLDRPTAVLQPWAFVRLTVAPHVFW